VIIMEERKDATECVGALTMRVEVAPPTPEAAQRWQQRADALTAWLLAEWQREQRKEAA
jgi:hypothetical protein